MPGQNHPPAAQRLIVWLSEAARRAREDAGVKPELVAAYLGRDGATIKRFEKHAGHWPRDPDLLVAAYAKAIGLADGRQLYQEALDLWYKQGAAPTLGDSQPVSPRERFDAATAEQQARQAAPPAGARKSSATRKKRANP